MARSVVTTAAVAAVTLWAAAAGAQAPPKGAELEQIKTWIRQAATADKIEDLDLPDVAAD